MQWQLRAGLTCVESVLRFCALAGIAVARGAKGLDDGMLDRLALPSTGTWLELCKALTPQVGEAPFARRLRAVTRKESGGPWLDYFLLAAISGPPVELLVPGTMTRSRGFFNVEWERLTGTGSGPNRITTELPTARPQADRSTCVWARTTPTPGHASWRSLTGTPEASS
jgi:hypothetical protein